MAEELISSTYQQTEEFVSETVNCKECGTLVWATDIPSKMTGFCWRCEIKRLKAVSKHFEDENSQLREHLGMAIKERDYYSSSLFVSLDRIRHILYYYYRPEITEAIILWREWKDGIDLLNPPPQVDEIFKKLEPLKNQDNV